MRYLVLLFCSCILSFVHATPPKAQAVFQAQVERRDANLFVVTWQIKPGFYLYKKRIHLTPTQTKPFNLGEVHLPRALTKLNAQHHRVSIYRNTLILPVPILGKTPGEQALTIHYQGCADDGFCYPPQALSVLVQINDSLELVGVSTDSQALPASETDNIESLLTHQSFLLTLLSFFGFGILLSFTPCVLPMIPVLSGIILQHQAHLTTKRAFLLSLSYVLGLSLTYALIGAGIAYLGNNFQLAFQSPWIRGGFAVLFIALALSMFDVFHLRAPARWQQWVNQVSKEKWGGAYCSTAILGALSSLILSPCVTPPLVGTLAYIAHTGNVMLGSLALFCLGFGSGLPLLLIGTSAGRYLPKAGRWMNIIKICFGILLLGIALQLILELPVVTRFTHHSTSHQTLVRTLPELQQALSKAKGHPVILDFYADWCADCNALEVTTLQNKAVREALKHIKFIKVDVTQNDSASKILFDTYHVIAPPTFIFINRQGIEDPTLELVGMTSPRVFLKHIHALIGHSKKR